MFRSIFTLGAFAILGILALKLVFGVMGGLVGLLMVLLVIAIKIAMVGLLVYAVMAVVAPDTLRRWRDNWSRP